MCVGAEMGGGPFQLFCTILKNPVALMHCKLHTRLPLVLQNAVWHEPIPSVLAASAEGLLYAASIPGGWTCSVPHLGESTSDQLTSGV